MNSDVYKTESIPKCVILVYFCNVAAHSRPEEALRRAVRYMLRKGNFLKALTADGGPRTSKTLTKPSFNPPVHTWTKLQGICQSIYFFVVFFRPYTDSPAQAQADHRRSTCECRQLPTLTLNVSIRIPLKFHGHTCTSDISEDFQFWIAAPQQRYRLKIDFSDWDDRLHRYQRRDFIEKKSVMFISLKLTAIT